MPLSQDAVTAASRAWLWFPDEAEVVDDPDFLLVRWPAWFESPPTLMRFTPAGEVLPALDRVLGLARAWGFAELVAWVKLDAPAGLEEILAHRGRIEETLDVFALDLADGVPELDAPPALRARWRDDLASSRDFVAVGIAAFEEGSMPSDEVLLAHAREAEADRLAGRGGQLIVLDDAGPIGAAGLTMAEATARLWGAGVVPEARGRGAYRALLAARLEYAVAHGATMALVKGRVETSGPVLRRVGFASYGQERSYVVPVPQSPSTLRR